MAVTVPTPTAAVCAIDVEILQILADRQMNMNKQQGVVNTHSIPLTALITSFNNKLVLDDELVKLKL